MKKWLIDVGYKARQFMQGRYGYDELSRFLLIASLVFFVLSYVPYLRVLYFLAIGLIIWSWVRSFSRNFYKRQMERQKYLEFKNRIKQKFVLYRDMWRSRKTHKYYKCPHCRAIVRIRKPEKRKRIAINCPKCGLGFEKKT